ncbi:polysaccharide deacetylase family protein [Streptomyces griseoincarnatus]
MSTDTDRVKVKNPDPSFNALRVEQVPAEGTSDTHTAVLRQKATGGVGSALSVESDNPDVAAAVVQGVGDLLDLRNAEGETVLSVGNDGALELSDGSTAASQSYVDDTVAAVVDDYLPLTGGSISSDLDVVGRLTAAGFTLPMNTPAWVTPYAQGTPITNYQTGHGWGTSGSVASSSLNDTSDFVKGTQSASVTFSGNGNFDKSGISSTLDLTGKAVRFLVKVDDVSKLSQLNIKFGTSATNCYTWQTKATNGTNTLYQSGEWTQVVVSWADVHSGAGTHTLDSNRVPSTTSGFSFIRFQVIATGGNCTVHFQSVEIIDDITAHFPNGVVSVVFDDSWDNQYTLARPMMDPYGYRGTAYTIADSIGGSGRMTATQLRNLQDLSGWEIAGHAYQTSVHDSRLTSFTAAEVDDDLRNLRAWLVTNGFRGDSFAYPGGNFARTTDNVPIERIVSRYFSSGRTILSTYGSAVNVLKEQFPPPRPYRTLALSAIGDYPATGGMDDPDNIVAAGGILDVTKRQGAWLVLTFHHITAGAAAEDTECSQAAFGTIMDAINSYGIPVLPVSEVMRYRA